MRNCSTLEEFFLAKYEALEDEVTKLKEENWQLSEQLKEMRGENDTGAVRRLKRQIYSQGRQKLFSESIRSWSVPSTQMGERDFDEWCDELIYKSSLPDDVPLSTFTEVFADELNDAWERKYDEEVKSEAKE